MKLYIAHVVYMYRQHYLKRTVAQTIDGKIEKWFGIVMQLIKLKYTFESFGNGWWISLMSNLIQIPTVYTLIVKLKALKLKMMKTLNFKHQTKKWKATEQWQPRSAHFNVLFQTKKNKSQKQSKMFVET